MLLGRAADLLGRRRVLVAGFALFGTASLACGLAQAPWQLLAARAVPGPRRGGRLARRAGAADRRRPGGPARTHAARRVDRRGGGGGALGWVARRPDRRRARAGRGCSSSTSHRAERRSRSRLRMLPADPGRRGRRADSTSPGAVTATAGLALLVLGFTRAEQAGPGDLTAWGSLLAAAALLAAFAPHRAPRRRPAAPAGHAPAAAPRGRAARVAGHHHREHRTAVPVRALSAGGLGRHGGGDRAPVRPLQPRGDRRLGGRRPAARRPRCRRLPPGRAWSRSAVGAAVLLGAARLGASRSRCPRSL